MSPSLNVLVDVVLGAPTPSPDPLNPPPLAPPGMEPVAAIFLGWSKWILMTGGVIGLFICAGMLIIGRRNRSSTAVEGAYGIPSVLAGLSLAAVAAGLVGELL